MTSEEGECYAPQLKLSKQDHFFRGSQVSMRSLDLTSRFWVSRSGSVTEVNGKRCIGNSRHLEGQFCDRTCQPISASLNHNRPTTPTSSVTVLGLVKERAVGNSR
jgi:hypothetical protein